MLKLTHVSKKFGSIEVLKDLSCELRHDDFVIVMGPNGAGKSTFFETIAGKLLPDTGSIEMNGANITHLSEQQRARFIGRLYQNTFLSCCSNLTVRENLAIVHLKEKRATFSPGLNLFSEEIVEELIKPLNLNLERLLDVPMGALSGGQRQIISFIMTILTPPKLLLLDEPTAALDPLSATILLSFAQNYAYKHYIPTLLITHDPMIAKHLGNKLWILQEGRIAKEYGAEKQFMNPQEFFHTIDYENLQLNHS